MVSIMLSYIFFVPPVYSPRIYYKLLFTVTVRKSQYLVPGTYEKEEIGGITRMFSYDIRSCVIMPGIVVRTMAVRTIERPGRVGVYKADVKNVPTSLRMGALYHQSGRSHQILG